MMMISLLDYIYAFMLLPPAFGDAAQPRLDDAEDYLT